MSTLPTSGATELTSGQAVPETTVNAMGRALDAGWSRAVIEDRDLTAPPGTCGDGANYLVAASPTGLWAGQAGKMASAQGTNASNGWVFIAVAKEGIRLYVKDEDLETRYNGSAWVDQAEVNNAILQGKHTIPVMAGAMTTRSTNGAASGTSETTTNKVMVRTLDFDQSADEFAQFMIPMPKSWNEGTVTANFYWTATTTGNVVWGIQGVAISDDDALDAAFGTAQTVTDSVTAANDLMISSETSAVTIAGTPATSDLVVFQVYRDADNGSDTLAADAKLLGIKLFITYDAGTDA